MSAREKPSPERDGPLQPRTPSLTPRRSPPQLIEFIDSQDPNTKSAIQRHTAQHAAAQRREAKILAVREAIKPRNLEWRRRLGLETSANSSATDTPPEPAAQPSEAGPDLSSGEFGLDTATDMDLTRQESIDLRAPVVLNSAEDSLLRHYPPTRCHNAAHRAYYESFLASVRRDEACTYLLIAYVAAGRALVSSTAAVQRESETSMFYKGKGHDIIIQRLSDDKQRCSDATIQAVLILIAFVQRFHGIPGGIDIHVNALQEMVLQRGGLSHFQHSGILEYQLRCIASGDIDRILECGKDCEAPSRST